MYIYYKDCFTEENFIDSSCQGFQFGLGVFETILVEEGYPCFMEEHCRRMQKSADRLGLAIELDFIGLRNKAAKLIELNNINTGRLKIIGFRDVAGDSVMMTLAPYQRFDEAYCMKLRLSSLKRNPCSPLTYMKSLNYMDSILAREEAKNQGYDEALFLNVFNKLCEGAVSNLFWIKDETLFTPDAGCGILEGVTRNQVIALCGKLNMKLLQGCYELTSLLQADEVFITNSLMGIIPVSKVDDTEYHVADYILTYKIRKEYEQLLWDELKRKGF